METTSATKPIPTLYEWAGGMPAFEKLTEAFYKNVFRDELLEPVFRHMAPNHAVHVAHFLAEVFGGPAQYSGDGGSHFGMIQKHFSRHLTEQQRRRWVQLLLDTADEIELPDDPEFRSAFVAYLEWGTRLAVINSNASDIALEPQAPMPRWGWGEPGGPYQG